MRDKPHMKEASKSLKVFNIEWQTRVAAKAACVTENHNLKMVEKLPDIKDIMTLGKYLKREIKQQVAARHMSTIRICNNDQDFRGLQELVLGATVDL